MDAGREGLQEWQDGSWKANRARYADGEHNCVFRLGEHTIPCTLYYLHISLIYGYNYPHNRVEIQYYRILVIVRSMAPVRPSRRRCRM